MGVAKRIDPRKLFPFVDGQPAKYLRLENIALGPQVRLEVAKKHKILTGNESRQLELNSNISNTFFLSPFQSVKLFKTVAAPAPYWLPKMYGYSII